MAGTEDTRSITNRHLFLHYAVVFALYIVATRFAYILLSIPTAHESFIVSLSSAAILATFGSAITAVGSLWTGDYANRIVLNVDILFKDILKQKAWRRWQFLSRGGTRKLFGGNVQRFELHNPKLQLNVGSHNIEIIIPTVQEDFFDLPLFKNALPLLRFRTAAHTIFASLPRDKVSPQNQLKPMDEFMAYECLTDIWWSMFVFRAARYVVHFGAALTLASAFIGGSAAFASAV